MKKIAIIALAGIAAFAGLHLKAETPDKFVRYVEATGSQYVDTGITGRYNTKTECKVEWMNLADTAFLASGYWSDNTRFYACWCSSPAGNMFTAQGKGDKVNNGQDLLFEKKRVYTYTTDFSAPDENEYSTNTVAIDGTKVFSKAYPALDTGYNLYVFANNQKGTAAGFSKTRCYGLKIWQDGTLVRDFKPCVHGGRAGLYDAQNDKIYYSASGRDLVYDTNCDVPDAFIDYVESRGNSYIDTGIIGCSGTSAQMELALMGNSDQAILASRDGNARFYLIHNGGGSQWLWGYGGYGKFGSFTVGTKYHVDSSFAVGAQSITVREGGPDGSVVGSYAGTSATDIDTGRSLYLFCCNQSGSALAKQYWGKARVYWLKIYQDGKLVRDFKPCLKYGQAALYDDVSKTIFYPEGEALAFDNSVAADGDSLIYVDYIEADGFTHLDTQVNASSPTRAEGTMAWTQMRTTDEEKQYLDENHHSYLACGCYNSDTDANRFYMIDQTAQKPWIGYGNKSQSFGSAYIAGTKYDFDVSFKDGEQSFSLKPEGGENITTTQNWPGEATGKGNLFLFACNDAKGGKPIYRSAARCYGLKIWQGETLVREFKPCVKDGQAALFDTVSRRIFYPIPAIPADAGAGPVSEESLSSPIASYLQYVETDGTQYIDTGVTGKAGTTVEFTETNLRPNVGNGDSEECLLGAVDDDTDKHKFYMWYHGTKDTLAFGYAGSYWRPSVSDPATPAEKWDVEYADVYRLYYGAERHARVSFAAFGQTVEICDDSTGEWKTISQRSLEDDINTGKNLYLFARNQNGTANSFSKSRLYFLRIWQDGTRVRKFRPAVLKNGLGLLVDVSTNKPYFPRTATGALTTFSALGPVDPTTEPGLLIIIK